MAESNLIQFKRGTSAKLKELISAKSGIDGTFYLTVDEANETGAVKASSRLYVGRADGTIVPVNQGITTVATTTELVDGVTHGDLHAGDFAYVEAGNVLAIYDGTKWKQINSVGENTYATDLDADIQVADGVATATITLTNSGDMPDVDAKFKVAGANGITVSAAQGTGKAGDTLTITGDQYAIGRAAAANNGSVINLTSDQSHDSSIEIKGGTNVTVTTSGDNVIELAAASYDVTAVELSAETAGFKLEVTQHQVGGSEVTVDDTIDPTIVLGDNTSSPIHFANGVATLPVYTKDEIDAQKKALNAMTYKGTVGIGGSAATSIAGITAAGIGDTFKATEDLTLATEKSSTGAAVSVKKGDLLIAVGGDEGDDGNISGTIKFDVVPSGDETDTQYELQGIEHGVELVGSTDSTSSNIGSFGLVAGDGITLNDNATTDAKRVTVAHATYTKQANTTGTAQEQSAEIDLTIPVITDITLDNGHVTKWEVTNYKVKDTNATLSAFSASASAANNVATVTTAMTLGHETSNDETGSAAFKLESDNLEVTAPTVAEGATPEVKVNFIWGTF